MTREAFRFAPLPAWPGAATPAHERRSRLAFKAGWQDTLSKLSYEIERLGGRDLMIQAAFRPQDLRLDGLPRSDARTPSHPGIIVQFTDSRGQRLSFATDTHERWEHNVRAIALSLEALRAVDRYGATRKGEQYSGFRELTSGGPDAIRGAQLVEQHGSVREALHATHPDHNGNASDFADVQAYRELAAA